MKQVDLVRGTRNIFKDLGLADADVELVRAKVAAGIIAIMRKRGLTAAKAATLAKVTPAIISRIRKADLSRFTIDRLVRILNSLGQHVALRVRATPPRRRQGTLRSSALTAPQRGSKGPPCR